MRVCFEICLSLISECDIISDDSDIIKCRTIRVDSCSKWEKYTIILNILKYSRPTRLKIRIG